LFIVDRQKDLIKTSGYQVWPREVEEVLALHPGVMDVGVAGIADDVKGEVVKAWVVRRRAARRHRTSSAPTAGQRLRLTRSRRKSSSVTACQRR
jgi:acyl-CoA synthetase (AMP-forming)/AMP-acid ligase II